MREADLGISVVEPVGGHGGMDFYDFALCDALVGSGVEVTLYTCDETEVPPGARFQIELVYKRIFGADPSWRRGLRYLIGTVRALTAARSAGHRLSHFHFFHVGPLEFFNVLVARFLGLRVIVTAHDVESFVTSLSVGPLVRFTYELAHRVVAHNSLSRRELLERVGLSCEKVVVIPSGNYLAFTGDGWGQASARQRLDLPPQAPILLFFGQIKTVKGLDILLQSLPAVIEQFPHVLLLITGKVWKDDFGRYQRIIDELGLAKHCRIRIEYVPNAEVATYFVAADLVVLPYRRIYQSAVLLMAMSYGKAVLTSDIDGMTEMLTHGSTAYLFRAGSAHSCSERIIEALSDSTARTRVAQAGLRLMKEQYAWQKVAQDTAKLYRSICA